MDIRLVTNKGVEEAAQIIESLTMVLSDSMENGSNLLPPTVYADLTKLMCDIATAIKEKAGCAA